MAFRDRLTKTKVSLKQTIADLKDMGKLVDNSGAAPASLLSSQKSNRALKLVEEQIKHTDKQWCPTGMEATLQEDEQIQNHFQLITSVVGIGGSRAVWSPRSLF